jgi:2-polyprenyl-3-methyl-5-hydroxy-6-metoxy-1,4-benzoquinol methylase
MDNREINLEEFNKKSIEYWEDFFGSVTTNEIKYDDWLERFQNEINNCKTPIIDLGCGIGNDSKYLIEKGKEVIPCDF